MTKERIFPEYLCVQELNDIGKGNMVEHLGIVFTDIGPNYLLATMPVDHRTKQPMGLLHGGASVALAETMGSIGANICLKTDKKYAVGMEINTNHIKSVHNGIVTGKTSPIHIGNNTHVWNVEIKNQQNQLVAVSRITMAILDSKQ